jgi:hypothetical protein
LLWWPHITLAQVMGPGSSINDAGAGYLSRLLDTLRQNNHAPTDGRQSAAAGGVEPSGAVAAGAAGRGPVAQAAGGGAAGGLLLPLAVMTAILPYQGHGFGYRYLHAQMGDAALLGAYGWQRLGRGVIGCAGAGGGLAGQRAGAAADATALCP